MSEIKMPLDGTGGALTVNEQQWKEMVEPIFQRMREHLNDSFHNTCGLNQLTLVFAEEKAQKQDELVLAFFKLNQGRQFTPLQVHDQLPHIMFTSIRRAITNLTKKGFLKKLDTTVPERFGKPNHLYSL